MKRLDNILDKYELRELEAALQKRRNRDEQKLARLVQKRRNLESELKKVEREIRAAASVTTGTNGKVKRKPNARRLNDISLADALERVMKGRKSPIHYKDLTDAVLERKLYRTRSKNLLSTVAVTLKRDRRFKKVEPGYYTLR